MVGHWLLCGHSFGRFLLGSSGGPAQCWVFRGEAGSLLGGRSGGGERAQAPGTLGSGEGPCLLFTAWACLGFGWQMSGLEWSQPVARASQCPQPWPAVGTPKPQGAGSTPPPPGPSETSRPSAHLASSSVQLKLRDPDHLLGTRGTRPRNQMSLKSAGVSGCPG